MNPFRTGKLVLFQVTYDRDWHFFEVIFFVILGIFGVSTPFQLRRLKISLNPFIQGLYGAFVIKFNLQVAAFRRKYLADHAVAEAVTLATMTAMIGYFNRFLRIDMTSSMAMLFRECDGNIDHLCQCVPFPNPQLARIELNSYIEHPLSGGSLIHLSLQQSFA